MKESSFVPDTFCSRPFWQRVLDKWLELLSAYENADPPDLGYWHGERPLTGLLGAAAWQVGGWSLEEFCGKKEKKRKHVIGSARADLRLGCGRDGATGNTVEAKICWVDQANIETAKNDLLSKLKQAKKQLRQLTLPHRVGKPMSLCYVVPCYAEQPRKQSSKERGEEALRILEEEMQVEGKATAKHLATTGNIMDDEEPGTPKYPGVLLIAWEVEWREE